MKMDMEEYERIFNDLENAKEVIRDLKELSNKLIKELRTIKVD